MAYSLHIRLTQSLLMEAASGYYKPGDRFLSVRKVSKYYEVAAVTAEKSLRTLVQYGVLNTRERSGFYVDKNSRIQALLKIRYYIRPLPPRSTWESRRFLMIDGSSNTPFPTDSYFAALFSSKPKGGMERTVLGFQKVCKRMGIQSQILYYGETSNLHEVINKLLEEKQCKGIALFCKLGTATEQIIIRSAIKKNKPLVLVFESQAGPNLFTLNFNNATMGFKAIQVLVKQGHRNILLLYEDHYGTYIEDRLIGAKLAKEALSLSKPIELWVYSVNSSNPYLPNKAKLAQLLGQVTAVYSTSSAIIKNMKPGFKELGLKIPKDLSIILTSGSYKQRGYATPFDIMQLNFQEIGKQAVIKLASLAEGKPVERATFIPVFHRRGKSVSSVTPQD